MIKTIKNHQEKGAALLLSIILILSVSLTIGLGLSSLALNSLISAQDKIKSIKSYYTAEAGIEDSLLRLKNGLQFSSPNSLAVGNSSTTIEISDPIGGARTITSRGNTDNRIRKLSATYVITTEEVSFFFGAQAGQGGIIMGNNSRIEGNVFSNGSILPGGGGTADITDTATVALNGNKIDSVDVGGDVYVHSCKDSDVTGTLYYVSGGSIENCTYGSLVDMGPEEIESEDLPIPLEQITSWKDEAAAGEPFAGDYTLDGGETVSLGPIKITGQMLIDNNSTLNITGTIYVEGNITIKNGATLQLDSSFGSTSGVVISDGKINIRPGVSIQGSGAEGSYLMLLSANNSLDPTSPAIDIDNNAQAGIFYASNGLIVLHNNINVREATAYQLALDNLAVISYEVGLENINFISGPGGSWRVENWQEIE
jgi:hypothetical protein